MRSQDVDDIAMRGLNDGCNAVQLVLSVAYLSSVSPILRGLGLGL